jgi:serine/threonine protein phosphatase PrpC
MGGHQGGSTASRLLIDTVCNFFDGASYWGAEQVRAAIEAANERIFQVASEDINLAGMGTTVVAVLFRCDDGAAWVAHVGDSRAYRLRHSALEPLTEDHSAVAELLRHGQITPAQAVDHPRRNEILRSVGICPTVEVEVASFDLRPGDQLLLCSDGLSGVLRDREIAVEMQRSRPVEAVPKLIAQANSRGGPDNVTVMVSALTHETLDVSRWWEPIRSWVASTDRRNLAAAAGTAAALLIVIALLVTRCAGSDAPPATGDVPTAGSAEVTESSKRRDVRSIPVAPHADPAGPAESDEPMTEPLW